MRALRIRYDDWRRRKTVARYQHMRDALSDNLPAYRTRW